jgi:hypothetical protein
MTKGTRHSFTGVPESGGRRLGEGRLAHGLVLRAGLWRMTELSIRVSRPDDRPPIDTQTIARLANGRGGIVRFLRDGNARVVPTLDNLGMARTRIAVPSRQTRERVR